MGESVLGKTAQSSVGFGAFQAERRFPNRLNVCSGCIVSPTRSKPVWKTALRQELANVPVGSGLL